jgi:molecular chaperone GrpE
MQNQDPAAGPAGTTAADDAGPADDRVNQLEDELNLARAEQVRLLAEMDNQRKRLARDVEAARKYGTERLLGDLLPVVDSLVAGLGTATADADKLREGMVLTLQLLDKALENHGLHTVNPQGERFDPARHQAMSLVDGNGADPGTVVAVFQKGYVLNDRLLRPALVAVAREPT